MIDNILNFIYNLSYHPLLIVGILFLLAIIHVLISQPMSFLTFSFGAIRFGIPFTLIILGSGYIIGSFLFYVLFNRFESKLNMKRFPSFFKALTWLEHTPLLSHIIALGTPLVPTYAIKVMLALSSKPFKHYFFAMLSSYVLLTGFNVLLYYGIFETAFLGEDSIITFVILTFLVLLMYGLNYRFNKKSINKS